MDEPIISVRDLVKFPGKQRAELIHVLRSLNRSGERIRLYRRSFRMWKTTLLNAIAGF